MMLESFWKRPTLALVNLCFAWRTQSGNSDALLTPLSPSSVREHTVFSPRSRKALRRVEALDINHPLPHRSLPLA